MEQRMVKVSIVVRNGTARFRVGVQARSIGRALSLVRGRYPQGEVRVALPIDPDHFFVAGLARAGIVEPEHPKELAA